jgi:hypothetical protein
MPANSDVSYSRNRTSPSPVQLVVWPPRDEPLRMALIASFILAAGVLAASATGGWPTGILISTLLFAATWNLWLPVKFELGPKGIVRSVFRWRRRFPWSEFGSYELQPHGVFLWPLSRETACSPVHGLFLPRETPHPELLQVLDYYLRPRLAEGGNSETLARPGGEANDEGGKNRG